MKPEMLETGFDSDETYAEYKVVGKKFCMHSRGSTDLFASVSEFRSFDV